jgi:hypothetical protein
MTYSDRLRKKDWEVRAVTLETCQRLVAEYHYAGGGSNTATYRHGLFKRGAFWEAECMGVAWWIPPTQHAAKATYPDDWQGVLSLSRLVIHPDVPKNACSFLLASSMRMIDRSRWPCLVTYASERMGHIGTIYKATNWAYAGKTKPEPVYINGNGVEVARKAGPVSRSHGQMVALGHERLGRFSKHKYVHVITRAGR